MMEKLKVHLPLLLIGTFIIGILVGSTCTMLLSRKSQPHITPSMSPAPEPVVTYGTQTSSIQPMRPEDTSLYTYPDYSLSTIPTTPISAKYLVEHRSALNEKSVFLTGTVITMMPKEKTCPSRTDNGIADIVGMCGQPFVVLADTTDEKRDKNYDMVVRLEEEAKPAEYPLGQSIQIKVTVAADKTGINAWKASGDEIGVSPSFLNTSCREDADCSLVNTDRGFDCSYARACEPVDYSLNMWVAVNQQGWSSELNRQCPNRATQGSPACFPKPINDNFTAQCINFACKKVAN